MATPFAPDQEDDDKDGSPYYGQGAQTLLAPPPSWAPDPQQQAPAQAPVAQVAPPPQQQQQAPTILLPTAPEPPPDNTPQYKVLTDKQKADSVRTQVAPKWWERLAGAAVGFGVGYKDGPTAGIKAGSAVTGRGQAAADADQQSRLAGDQSAIENFQKQQDMSRKGYEDQLQAFGAKLNLANTQQAQSNADRNFQRDISNDKRAQDNADNTLDYEQQVHADTLNQQAIENAEAEARDAETARSHRANEANEAENRSTARAASAAALLRQGQDQVKADAARQAALKIIDNGDPKTGTDGYNQQLKDLQTTKKNNPETGKPYTDSERAAAIQALNEQHAADKAHVEETYANSLNALGIQAQPVQYAPDGKTPLNNTNGSAPAGAPAPAAAQPQQPQQPQQAPTPQQAGGPPKGNGRPLTDKAIAAQYVALAGGDKTKARALAAKDGWKF